MFSVQRKVFGPFDKPLTDEVGLFAFANVPVPPTTVHVPVPEVGVFPAKLAVVAQFIWSIPAFEVVSTSNVITTSSVEAVQGVLEIVQRKV